MPGSSRVHDYDIGAVDAIEATLSALRALNPNALRQLRDIQGDDDEAIAEEWATRHFLNSPSVSYCLAEQRRWWRLKPHHAERLQFGGGWESPVKIIVPSDEEERWVHDQFASRENRAALLPSPSSESLRDWLKRATNMYRKRASFARKKTEPWKTRKRSLGRHCRWFMEIQMGATHSFVAKRHGVDRTAVERETKRIAGILKVPLRQRPKATDRSMILSS